MEVGQLRVGQPAQGCAPGLVGRDRVAAYAQYLGIGILEPFVLLAERGRLCGSTRGEVEYVKGQYDVFIPSIVCKGNVPIG